MKHNLFCAGPGCNELAKLKYCSNACKQRAFYWRFKEREGMRYKAQDRYREVEKLRNRRRRKAEEPIA